MKVKGLLVRMLALAALALAMPASWADGMRVQVRVTILPYVHLRTVHQPATLRVTAEDVRRGYVEVPAAYELRLRSNVDGAISLRIAPSHPVALNVVFERMETPLEGARAGGNAVSLRGARRVGDAPVRAAVRVVLSPQAAEGTYPWPALVSLAGA